MNVKNFPIKKTAQKKNPIHTIMETEDDRAARKCGNFPICKCVDEKSQHVVTCCSSYGMHKYCHHFTQVDLKLAKKRFRNINFFFIQETKKKLVKRHTEGWMK